MRRVRAWALRLAGVFGAGRRDAEIHAELEAHMQMLEDEYTRAGLPRAEARRRSRAAFGSVPAVAETYRDRRGLPSLERWRRNVGHAARSLRRSPVQTAAMILVLGLGIGTSTLVAGMFDTAVRRPLPVPEPDRVVKLALGFSGEFDRQVEGHVSRFSYPELAEYRAAAHAVAVAGVLHRGMTWSGPAEPRRLNTALVTGDYFRVLRAAAAPGRVLGPADASNAVVVISHRLWSEVFASRADAIGETIVLNRIGYAIVGVMQDGFTGTDLEPVDAWVPLEAAITVSGDAKSLSESNLSWLQVVGRLGQAASIESASAEAAGIAARFDAAHPGRHTSIAIARASLLDAGFFQPTDRAPLLAAGAGMTVAIAVLLLICGSNVAALLLARGTARQREIALRMALGAGRRRIAEELLAEVLVIASAATIVGLLAHVFASRLLGVWLPPLHGLLTTSLDARLVVLSAAFAGGVALFFGLAPLRQALRVDCLDTLKGQTTWLGARVPELRVRHVLAGGQIAVSVVLLVATALLGRAIDRALATSPGYPARDTYAVRVQSTGVGPRNDANDQDYQLVARLRDRLAHEPGVQAAGLSNLPPFAGRAINAARPGPDAKFEAVQVAAVDDAFFRALDVVPTAGRLFANTDQDVVVVNAALARRYWQNAAAAVGQRLQIMQARSGAPRTVTVLGVIAEMQTTDVGMMDGPAYYVPLPAPGAGDDAAMGLLPAIVLRASPGTPVARVTRDLVNELSPGTIVTTTSIDGLIETRTAPARAGRTATGLIGVMALLVAAIGIHGLVAQAVTRRTRDIGVCIALGASRADVVRTAFGRTLRAIGIGAAAGLGLVTAIGAAFNRDLSAALFGLTPLDPWSFLGAAGVLVAVTAAAVCLPARRALGIDPAAALRADQ